MNYMMVGDMLQHALLSTLCILAQIVAAILSSVFQATVIITGNYYEAVDQ